MTQRLEKHIAAARREVRVHSWNAFRVGAAWRDLSKRYEQRKARRVRAMWFGGAALALAFAVALVFGTLKALEPTDPVASAPGRKGSDSERIAFDDGTEVHFEGSGGLNVAESNAERVVVRMQTGTAHFRVRHNPKRVFRVEAGDVLVEDLGTTFIVRNDGNSVAVSVSEGSVVVTYSGSAGRQRVTLGAGDSGQYASGVSSAAAASAPLEEALQSPTSNPDPATEASAQAPTNATRTQSKEDWRELARTGDHRGAYGLIAPQGFQDVRNDPGDLLLASDVARLSRHPTESAMLLRRLLAHHDGDPRAPSAAFTLGWVLMSELGRPREAAQAFARAEALAPGGNLAQDAGARAVEAWYRAGDLDRARTELARYRKRYPNGRHQAMLERLVGTP